jgi:hypothetical protein
MRYFNFLIAAILQIAMENEERRDFLREKDGRGKKDKKRRRKDRDEKTSTRKSDKEEKETVKQLKDEMDKMRKTIEKLTADKETTSPVAAPAKYALDFNPHEYLARGFIESANWVKETLALNMRERMNAVEGQWDIFKKITPPEMRSLRPCVAFNRGEGCRLGIWHTVCKKVHVTQRLDEPSHSRRMVTYHGGNQSDREELRVHCCSLCLKALGSLCMHNVLDCPWILEENWINSVNSTISNSA